MKSTIEGSIGLDMIKVMLESPVSYLSGNKIFVGDKWESKFVTKPQGMELTIITNYKCKSIADSKAELAGDVVIESPENGIMNAMGTKSPYELRGMGATESTIDLNTGWIIQSKGRQKMQGSITFAGNAAPMEIEATFETEAVK
jgi:hypothetical protein